MRVGVDVSVIKMFCQPHPQDDLAKVSERQQAVAHLYLVGDFFGASRKRNKCIQQEITAA